MSIEIKSIKGYYTLDVWIIGNIIQLSIQNLCGRVLNRNNDPCGRQYDQMTQAARSITANIAEGCSRHQTSRETELKLLDVARASTSELLGDIFFMMLRLDIEPWAKSNQYCALLDSIRLDKPDYSVDWEQRAWLHVKAQYAKFAGWIEHQSLSVSLNSMLLLCNREIALIERLIKRNLEDFKREGGFTENMTAERLVYKKQKASAEDAPKCPKCGAVMIERVIKRGSNSGKKFWGCSDYPNCDGVLSNKQSTNRPTD